MGNNLITEILDWVMMAGLGILSAPLLYVVYTFGMSYINGHEEKPPAKRRSVITRKK